MAAPLHGALRGNAGRQDVPPRVRPGGCAAPRAAPRAHHAVSPVGAERRRMGPLVPSVHAGHDLRRGAERQRRAGLAAADASLVALPSLRRALPAAALRAGRHVLRGMARRGIRPRLSGGRVPPRAPRSGRGGAAAPSALSRSRGGVPLLPPPLCGPVFPVDVCGLPRPPRRDDVCGISGRRAAPPVFFPPARARPAPGLHRRRAGAPAADAFSHGRARPPLQSLRRGAPAPRRLSSRGGARPPRRGARSARRRRRAGECARPRFPQKASTQKGPAARQRLFYAFSLSRNRASTRRGREYSWPGRPDSSLPSAGPRNLSSRGWRCLRG